MSSSGCAIDARAKAEFHEHPFGVVGLRVCVTSETKFSPVEATCQQEYSGKPEIVSLPATTTRPTNLPAPAGFFAFGASMDNTVLYIGGAVATAIGTVSFWMLRSLVARVEANEKELAAFKLEAAKTFVTSSALEKAIDRLSESINAVFAKLEQMDEKFDRRLESKADK